MSRPRPSQTRHSFGLVGGIALTLLVGCSNGAGAPGSAGTPEDPPVYGASDTPFLALVPDAPFVNAFRGVRRVDLRYGNTPVVYREDVGADGQGNFSVQPLEILAGSSNEPLFEALLAMRQVFLYRQRDWRITDYDLFQQNYSVGIVDYVQVAGVDCVRVMMSRLLSAPPSHYLADVDPLTGIVLRWEERDDQDKVLALVEFESFEYDGDVSDMVLVEHAFPNTTAHPIDGNLESVFGFEPVVPTMMPASGVEMSQEIERIDASGQVWAKVTMTDGLETAMILSRAPDGPLKLQPSTVTAVELGTWVGMEGHVSGQPVRVAGKFPLPLLQLTLESAF